MRFETELFMVCSFVVGAVITVLVGCCVWSYSLGKDKGNEDYFKGETICQYNLSKQIECISKDRVK